MVLWSVGGRDALDGRSLVLDVGLLLLLVARGEDLRATEKAGFGVVDGAAAGCTILVVLVLLLLVLRFTTTYFILYIIVAIILLFVTIHCLW